MNKEIYVIGPSNGPIKIGISDNTKNRRSILNVGNPNYLRIHYIHTATSEDEARRIEKELHYHYQSHHIRGEWFQLCSNDIPDVIHFFNSLIRFTSFAPDDWSLERKGCDEFTPEVCKTARNGIGLTVQELAKKANISISTLNSFEAGSNTPNIDTIESIKNAFEELGIEFIREEVGKKLRVLI
ncbi:GIY-YIG nuclease family protein [Aeromonas piscicola]|uniref:GIY-YIG nuclease family protein n=1 Tax=Aeromonas piscicola TaxID=600645 RepID=UPI0021F91C6E|nr:GIY-YIG nuclease family protein [Aeromonas piscicola]MCW0507539.1 GIY-YIG nuclease family protein [Aeromonas piscicola]